jgi:predicted ATP-dependent endonuclease of OLD family
MLIKFVEIQNFRKLKSVRIDFSKETTLCVGANNSGKTSAMVALRHFLVNASHFTPNDFTLSNWAAINKTGSDWELTSPSAADFAATALAWESILPTLDLWLEVGSAEVHYVRNLIPTLDWAGGNLGVRLRYEPNSIEDLAKEYLAACKAAKDTKEAGCKGSKGEGELTLTLWPSTMRSFLDRKLRTHFTSRCYLLDPTKEEPPKHGVAKPQPLPPGSDPIEGDPLRGLIRIDVISAQRELSDYAGQPTDEGEAEGRPAHDKRKLSEHLKAYFDKHLDPSKFTEAADLDALQAIEGAQRAFDERLAAGFKEALAELADLNYPGITDPRLKIATRLLPRDGMNHNAAVQYDVGAAGTGDGAPPMTLPEQYNGLGYQNLILMVFKLMSFRDAWMQVGKALKTSAAEGKDFFLPPLHLVIVEEPEAYLHAQVQQVFVKKAYAVLRNHVDLRDGACLTTQLIVSTHSSHIAHECDFAHLRYFRRLPASTVERAPISSVINLSEVFGPEDETARFVTRYLRATHCDLFFADAAILVEGPAERMLVPHFIRRHFDKLHCCFVTLLEIDGSHAHRLRPLIEHLGLTTLIITDLDSAAAAGHHKAVPPKRGEGQITRNSTMRTWHPEQQSLDALLDLPETQKAKTDSKVPLFVVRVAYQTPVQVQIAPSGMAEALATTFEDALVLENLALFKGIEDFPNTKAVKDAVNSTTDPTILSERLFEVVKTLDKAAFALDLLWLKEPNDLNIPSYIRYGLDWLQEQLKYRSCDEPMPTLEPAPPGAAS